VPIPFSTMIPTRLFLKHLEANKAFFQGVNGDYLISYTASSGVLARTRVSDYHLNTLLINIYLEGIHREGFIEYKIKRETP
jgi:hypothetical protein